jgi:hypothetical protein
MTVSTISVSLPQNLPHSVVKVKVQRNLRELEELVGKKNWERVKSTAVRLKYLLGIEKTANEMLRDM